MGGCQHKLPQGSGDFLLQKKELRRIIRKRRMALDQGHVSAAVKDMTHHATCFFSRQFAKFETRPVRVGGYWPMGSEMDSRPLMENLEGLGAALCLPVIVAEQEPLAFRAWKTTDLLQAGMHNTLQPCDACDVVVPDFLLVPLLAFDMSGGRLGQGAGYYDRTLPVLDAALPHSPLIVGLAYDAQKVDHVPMENHDRRLDVIVTEAGVIQSHFPPESFSGTELKKS